ncbi:serine/threonine-protein kinase [Agromyces aerolatus]|uniref:serine/threonine-protein kinase n=1 Tax=Agromyces sp. LY-1074 TaxID=3074080 RepID=UPI002857944F|nr:MULTISPECIES: serine/threonine-protein kinase [unclassified Agromyces]MDR5701146.1 serine/threonine-protein kinase [Agromyces sp. LY-1074]MDR5707786.1 serine/threonine-protein kinase [Agromyces sp. LY-1358]
MTAAPPDSAVDDGLVGAVLGERYRVTGLIGRGGVATVYRATDLALGREVAIKVFRGAEGLDDPERRRSETALLASLTHPALVTLHDSVRDPGTGREFLVMELVEGPNLRERLDADGPLDADTAAAMTVELAEALHMIHTRGIVHRDVKPANVLLAPSPVPTRAWRAKLADFGIARLVDDAHLTATGGLIGTPAYLAPEQVRGLGAGPGSDIYALGLLLLESRTGRAVFPGPALEAASARLTRDPELPGFLGADWRALIAAMLAREPGDRPSALEVAVAAAALGPDLGDEPGAGLRASSGGSAPPGVAQDGVGGAATGEMRERADASGGTNPQVDAERAADQRTVRSEATGLMPEPTGLFNGAQRAHGRDAETGMLAAEELDEHGDAPTMRLGEPTGTKAGTGTRGHRRRPAWLIPVGAVAALVVMVAITLPMLLSTTGGGEPEPTPAPIPSVPGELGVHLEELEEAVTP